MSWNSVNGEEKILPSTGSANEIILEPGKPKRVRPIFDEVNKEPYSFLEHTIEAIGPDGKSVFRTIRCRKTTKDPNAFCPICNGQQLKRRGRHACNAFDIESGILRKLCHGDDIFKPMGTLAKMGINPALTDWILSRTGNDRNDTSYSAVNAGVATQLPDNLALYNIEDEYAPPTVEAMKSWAENLGLDWNKIITPPELTYPVSLQDALNHVMPNGKLKDQTFSQIWDNKRDWIEFLATKSDKMTPEKAAAQVILVALGGANIPGVPNYAINATPINASGQPVPSAPAPTQTPTPATSAQPSSGADKQAKINKINGIVSTKPTFVKGGYQKLLEVMGAATAPANKTNISEFTDVELDKLLELCEKEQ